MFNLEDSVSKLTVIKIQINSPNRIILNKWFKKLGASVSIKLNPTVRNNEARIFFFISPTTVKGKERVYYPASVYLEDEKTFCMLKKTGL